MHAATLALALLLAGADPEQPEQAAAPGIDPLVVDTLREQHRNALDSLQLKLQQSLAQSGKPAQGLGSIEQARTRNAQEIATVQKEIAALQKQEFWIPEVSASKPGNEGAIVTLADAWNVVKVIDRQTVLLRSGDGTPVLRCGADTKRLRPGKKIAASKDTFRVGGREKHPDAGGQLTLVIEAIDLTPYLKPEKPEPETDKLSDEQKAANALRLAKQVLAAGSKLSARMRLQKLVAKYPNTEAAKEAATLLQGL